MSDSEVEVTSLADRIRTQEFPLVVILNDLIATIHGANKEAGWWSNLQTGEDLTCNLEGGEPAKRNVAELLMLCVSELGEAMEAHRKSKMDDHLPDRMGLTVELADCLIRIFDMAGGLNLDLAGAVASKLIYNAERADHKRESRLLADGKKF